MDILNYVTKVDFTYESFDDAHDAHRCDDDDVVAADIRNMARNVDSIVATVRIPTFMVGDLTDMPFLEATTADANDDIIWIATGRVSFVGRIPTVEYVDITSMPELVDGMSQLEHVRPEAIASIAKMWMAYHAEEHGAKIRTIWIDLEGQIRMRDRACPICQGPIVTLSDGHVCTGCGERGDVIKMVNDGNADAIEYRRSNGGLAGTLSTNDDRN